MRWWTPANGWRLRWTGRTGIAFPCGQHDFYEGKRQAVRYIFRYELPKTAPQLDLLQRLERTRWRCEIPGSDDCAAQEERHRANSSRQRGRRIAGTGYRAS
jgi:hypothetical protein